MVLVGLYRNFCAANRLNPDLSLLLYSRAVPSFAVKGLKNNTYMKQEVEYLSQMVILLEVPVAGRRLRPQTALLSEWLMVGETYTACSAESQTVEGLWG